MKIWFGFFDLNGVFERFYDVHQIIACAMRYKARITVTTVTHRTPPCTERRGKKYFNDFEAVLKWELLPSAMLTVDQSPHMSINVISAWLLSSYADL